MSTWPQELVDRAIRGVPKFVDGNDGSVRLRRHLRQQIAVAVLDAVADDLKPRPIPPPSGINWYGPGRDY